MDLQGRVIMIFFHIAFISWKKNFKADTHIILSNAQPLAKGPMGPSSAELESVA